MNSWARRTYPRRVSTRRGLRGQFERGYWTGGIIYGYSSEADYSSSKRDNRGEPVPDGYRLVVDEAEAIVIRRIFTDYDRGPELQGSSQGPESGEGPPPEEAATPRWVVGSYSGPSHALEPAIQR